jgi:hypothetical protein
MLIVKAIANDDHLIAANPFLEFLEIPRQQR